MRTRKGWGGGLKQAAAIAEAGPGQEREPPASKLHGASPVTYRRIGASEPTAQLGRRPEAARNSMRRSRAEEQRYADT